MQQEEHKPFVPSDKNIPEFTARALVLGSILGIVFGAANAYLGMKIGMTISASIPAAVMSMAILRGLLKKGTILENNIVQTIASSGESLAAGVIFTIPGFLVLRYLLRWDGVPESQLPTLPSMTLTFLVTLIGGFLGALAMIPLRRYLIVKEHKNLPFPEGTACAEVLVAGESGGSRANDVFSGIGLGSLYMLAMKGLKLFKDEAMWFIPNFHKGAVGLEPSAALLGVGFIIGPRIAAYMVAGAALGWLVLIPLIGMLGNAAPDLILAPGTKPISQMHSWAIASAYIRYIGAGAVAFGGIVSLIKSLPVIFSSFAHSIKGLKSRLGAGEEESRTEKDLPMWVVFGGAALSAVGCGIALYAIAAKMGIAQALSLSVAGGIVSVIFAFFFIAVAARIVGIVGSSSSPVSGMTITSLLAVCLVLVGTGFAGPQTSVASMAVALLAGAIVCVAVCSSGDISQDLKTGYLIGATPWRQQIAELIAVIIPTLSIVGTVYLLLLRGGGLNTLPQYEGRLNFTEDAVVEEIRDEKTGSRLLVFESGVYGRIPVGLSQVTLKNGVVLEGKVFSHGPEGLDIRLTQAGVRHVSASEIGKVFSYDDPMGELRAPQANIMAILVKGIIQGKLPWALVFIGALIALVVELLGVSSLAFAIGLYLGIATNMTIFIGGAVYWALSKWAKRAEWETVEQRGVLLASGMIAGDALMGIALAGLTVFGLGEALALRAVGESHMEDLITVGAFAVLTVIFVYWTRKRSS